MKNLMRTSNFYLLAVVVAMVPSMAGAGDALLGWSVSGGANFGFGLKTDLKTSPVNAVKNVGALHPSVGPTKKAALEAARIERGGERYVYDASTGQYVDPESSLADDRYTVNWKLPDSAVRGEGADRYFELDGGSWGEVVSSRQSQQDVAGSESAVTYGASVELSHALWAADDNSWGVDFVFGLTWMKANNCYRASGVAMTRNATVDRGNVATTITGDFFALPWAAAEADNTWGNGTYDGSDYSREAFELDLDSAQTIANTTSSQTYSDSMSISARGDYEEWELALMLRPWYDITDWLCVHGTIGLGVTRSSFDYSMEAVCGGASVYRSSEEFDEWRCYGLVGAGILCRVWDFDLSCDGLFRWCQQDMEINGRDVNGTVEKPWGVLRLGLSYAF